MTPSGTNNRSQSPGLVAQSGARSTAGFPSPADDYVERPLDLNRLLVKRPAATFFMRASGNALRELGIAHGDLLIVDRAREVTSGAVVVAPVDGELQALRLDLSPGEGAEPGVSSGSGPAEIWGVVTCVIHKLIP